MRSLRVHATDAKRMPPVAVSVLDPVGSRCSTTNDFRHAAAAFRGELEPGRRAQHGACDTPCTKTEDYHLVVELLEGDSLRLTWYVHNGVRLYEPYGESVPAPDEELSIEVVL